MEAIDALDTVKLATHFISQHKFSPLQSKKPNDQVPTVHARPAYIIVFQVTDRSILHYSNNRQLLSIIGKHISICYLTHENVYPDKMHVCTFLIITVE